MIWDPIRKKWVAATPEETVRQELIRAMLSLGYPKGLIAVERGLADRRFDLLCYAKKSTSLLPLLLAECKAEEPDERALNQVLGYNASVGAPFLCLAGKGHLKVFWFGPQGVASVPFLPSYEQLLQKL